MTNQSNEAQWLFFAPVIIRGENDLTNGRPGQMATLNFTVRSTILDGAEDDEAVAGKIHDMFKVAHMFVTEAQDVGGVIVTERDYSIVAQRSDDDSDLPPVGMDGSLFQTKLPHSPMVRASQPEAPAAPAMAAPATASAPSAPSAPAALGVPGTMAAPAPAPAPVAQASEILLAVNRFKITTDDGKKRPQFYGFTYPDHTPVERYGASVSWDLLKALWPDQFFNPDTDYPIAEGLYLVCTRSAKSPQFPSKVVRVATPEEIAAQHPF